VELAGTKFEPWNEAALIQQIEEPNPKDSFSSER